MYWVIEFVKAGAEEIHQNSRNEFDERVGLHSEEVAEEDPSYLHGGLGQVYLVQVKALVRDWQGEQED